MPLMQTSHGVCIRKKVRFFAAVGPVRRTGTITDNCKHFSIYKIPSSQRRQLRDDFKNFSLTLFDIWYVENNVFTT